MSFLDKIVAQRVLDVAEAKARVSEDELRGKIGARGAPADLAAIIRGAAPMGLLAEMKRASPSKGDISVGVDAAQQGLTYALAGACTISVLTEPTWFKGSLADMAQVRQALDAVPLGRQVGVLRKDFLIDEYQLLEARAHGADTALLIVAILSAERLTAMIAASRALGMEPLVEVNTEEEMCTALQVGAKVIGVNNRNLHTFEVDMGTTGRLAAMLPPGGDHQLIALSGVATAADVQSFAATGARAVLVGESLMRAAKPASLIRSLLSRPEPVTLCKTCGIRDAAAAAAATAAGADLIGVIFAKSKRQVTEEGAREIVAAVRARRPRSREWRMPTLPMPTDGVDGGAAGARRWLQLWSELLEQTVAAAGPLVVGVFVNASAEEMNMTAERVGLDLIQLHGDEGWEISRELCRPAIRVLHIDPSAEDNADVGVRAGTAAAVLLDSKGGGTGKTFDWRVTAALGEDTPFLLAGGLGPDNVADAVRAARPWCVDVSSGIETDGVKDHAKIEAFVRAAKAAGARPDEAAQR